MLENKGKSTRSVKAVLKDAKAVLSSVADRPENWANRPVRPIAGPSPIFHRHEFLVDCLELVEEFHRLLKNGTNFEFKDWTVVKAVVELVVRWAVYPYLSPGVGIPLEKRFGNRAASAAAIAVSDYHRGSESAGAPQEENTEAELNVNYTDSHPLVLSADLLSFIVLEIIAIKRNHNLEDTTNISGDHSEKDDRAAEDDDEKYHGQYTPAVVSSPVALRQHVLSHHLIDILAALLQIVHDEQDGTKYWKEEALERIRTILIRLPVDYVVEALFSFLGHGSSLTPPSWLKPEMGKLLSEVVVIRRGALATVMERLLGGAECGSVYVYERVAAHLAKVPRHVCTKGDYYKAVCTELRMLLFVPDISYIDSNTSKAHKNMHHTSIILACLLAHQESSLTEKYLLRALVDPLVSWSEFRAAESDRNINRLPENSLLDGLHVLKLLLTAGHHKSTTMRELLLRLTSPAVPKLILLGNLLSPSYRKHDARRFGGCESGADSRVTNVGKVLHTEDRKDNQSKVGLKVGFLEGQRLSTLKEEEDEEMVKGTVGHLMGCISDIVGYHLTQSTSYLVPIVFTFLFELGPTSLNWPCNEGQIARALEAGKGQTESPVMYLSRLLLGGEHWALSLALLDTLLKRVLGFRKAALTKSTITNPDQVMVQTANLLDTLEVLYVEVGFQAVEKDATRALPLLKILLDDDDLLRDGEMVELVLRLLHSAVCQLHEYQKEVEDDEHHLALKRAEQIEFFNSLGLSLEKITVSSQLRKEAKEFAASVRSNISQHLLYISTLK